MFSQDPKQHQAKLLTVQHHRQLWLMLFTLISFFSKAQSEIFREVYNREVPVVASPDNMARMVSALDGSTLYFSKAQPSRTHEVHYFYTYDLLSRQLDSIGLKRSKKTENFFKNRIFSFQVRKNTMLILSPQFVYHFKLNAKTAELVSERKNASDYNWVYWLNDKEAFLYVNYNFHHLNNQDRHVWGKWNIETDNIQSTPMPERDLGFTHLNNHWISTYKGLIAHARSTEYFIGFYDSEFRLVDSIKTVELESNRTAMSEISKQAFDSKDEITALIKLDDTVLTRIQKIYLLDTSHLLVMVKFPNAANKRRFDLWSRSEKGWERTKSEISETFYTPGLAYDSLHQPVRLIANLDGVSYVKPYLYIVYSPYRENVNTRSFDRKKDLDAPMNERVRANNLKIGIRKYEIVFD